MTERAKLTFYDRVLRPDPSRTVVRPFEPSYPRGFDDGPSRTQETVDLILGLDEAELARPLKGVTLSLDENRSEENTSELQSHMRTSSAVYCLKYKKLSTTTYRCQK